MESLMGGGICAVASLALATAFLTSDIPFSLKVSGEACLCMAMLCVILSSNEGITHELKSEFSGMSHYLTGNKIYKLKPSSAKSKILLRKMSLTFASLSFGLLTASIGTGLIAMVIKL
jgi:hypothetical protein